MPGPHSPALGKPKNTKRTFLRLLGYLKYYRFQLAVIVIAILISAGAGVAGTYMLKPIINMIGALATAKSTDLTGLVQYMLLLAAIYGLGALASYLTNRLVINVSTGALERVRVEMFTQMEKLPLRYFDSQTHGEIMSRFSNDTDALREMLGQGLPQLISCTITVAGVLTMMIVLSPLLTLLVMAVFALMLLIVKNLGKKSAFYFKRRQEALAATNGYIEEMCEGQREVKVFCHEEAVTKEFE